MVSEQLPFETELYSFATSVWPTKGKHILTTTQNTNVIVYQAYKQSIADWASQNNTFKGCPGFSTERMTWIKPNFLWMMYRSGWATKPNQEHILAIQVTEEGFKKLLALSKRRGGESDVGSSVEGGDSFGVDDVRIQWDPDHDHHGEKVERRAIQLGIRGRALQKFIEEWIVSISDITDFVKMQYNFVESNQLSLLRVPIQRVYELNDDNLGRHIDLDDILLT